MIKVHKIKLEMWTSLLSYFEKTALSVSGLVVSTLNSQSSSRGFEFRSSHFLDIVLGCPEFKSSAILVNSQLVATYQLEFLILLCFIWVVCF